MLEKKYSVDRLWVIKENKNGVTHFYIATMTMSDTVYVEVLNGKRLVVENVENVRPLTNYYSLLGVRDYTTGKVLKLTRDDILRKTIQINADYAITQYEKDMNRQLDTTSKISDLEERLHKATVAFFPKDGSWSSAEFRKDDRSLIQHLRDDKWLATELQRTKELQDVFFGSIYHYVKTSNFFKEERHAYEQRIVKWQIHWMISGGDGWLAPKQYGGDFIGFDENYDIGFRLGIYNTLRAIKIDSEAIEEGIEKNAAMWRESAMYSAFGNRYAPILSFVGEKLAKMEPVREEFKNAWLRMRMYEYYQAHKDSVEKYGEITPEMQMNEEEVESLRQYLAQMHKERMAYLEELKNSKVEGGPTFTLSMYKQS